MRAKSSKQHCPALCKNSTVQKIVLSSSRGQGNFRGPKTLRPRPRTCGIEAKAKDFKMYPVIHLYQRIDYYCKLIYTQSPIWSANYYLFNFGSEKYMTTVR